MVSMVPVARRMLFSNRRRAVLGVLGVAVALVMALALDSIFAGTTRQVSRYIDSSAADVFVSEKGVRTIHMSVSVLADSVLDTITELPGVAWAEPILFSSDSVQSDLGDRRASYVIGYEPGGRGGPATIVSGEEPEANELVLDESAATALSVQVGDTVETLGRTWQISGLTTGMTSITNTTAYVRYDDLAAALGRQGTPSYVLVGTRGDADEVALEIEEATGQTAQTRPRFSAEERAIVRQMSTDLMLIMSVAAFVVALAVVGLTLYASVLSRLRDIGVMKALGSDGLRVSQLVLTQAAWTVSIAMAIAVALTYSIGAIVAALAPDIDLVVEARSVARIGIAAVFVGLVGAIAPIFRVSRVDPASVFRRAS
jgi:putative ABC transport system permease protein